MLFFCKRPAKGFNHELLRSHQPCFDDQSNQTLISETLQVIGASFMNVIRKKVRSEITVVFVEYSILRIQTGSI